MPAKEIPIGCGEWGFRDTPMRDHFDIAHQLATYGRRFDSIVLACGAQMGKTEAALDVIGHTLDQRPAPIMYVGPNRDFLHKEIEPRLTEMLTTTASFGTLCWTQRSIVLAK